MTLVPTYETNGNSGDFIVFLHGIGGNSGFWESQLSFFGHWFQTIAWNMPGYGTSDAVPKLTFPILVEALERLLDFCQLEKFHLVGHSMGGMVAQEYLVKNQDRVISLTLFATSAAFGKNDSEWQQNFIRKRLKPLEEGGMEAVATQIIPELLSVNVDPKIREKAKKILTNCKPETYRSALQCLVTFDRRSELSEINTPTLLVTGEQDTQAPPIMMERMADKIANSRFYCLKGAGHLASLEQPETFNNVVLEFISKHTSLPFTKKINEKSV